MAEPSSNLRRATRILLVDDDPVMRELATAKLADSGYDTRAAENGEQALEMLDREGAELVISDLDMPVMDGFELTRRIRHASAYCDIPVIVITASDQGDSVEKAFAAGATSFLAKPINWSLFSHAILFVLKAASDQAALKAARDQAESGARFKDSLLSIMSHELRTPLNAIIGFGQILSEQFERERDHLHREYSDYIVDGGKRLLESLSDMLLASEARSDMISLSEADCTLGEILDLALAPLEKTITQAQAEITLAAPERKIELCCDRQLVARAVTKLLDNAVKFSQRGVKITLGAVRLPDDRVAILVKDSGPGVSPERLEAMRQPFAQLDMSLHRSREGLGLGLPLVQAIALAHGAQFRLQSEPGRGAEALLLFPRSRLKSTTPRKPGRDSTAAA